MSDILGLLQEKIILLEEHERTHDKRADELAAALTSECRDLERTRRELDIARQLLAKHKEATALAATYEAFEGAFERFAKMVHPTHQKQTWTA